MLHFVILCYSSIYYVHLYKTAFPSIYNLYHMSQFLQEYLFKEYKKFIVREVSLRSWHGLTH